MNKRAWVAFWILGTIWGSSFLFIRIGVEEMAATQVVLIRTVIAAIGLNLVRHVRGFPIPRDWPTIRALIIIGIGNGTVPYTLIAFSELHISSGMAAVLQATASLFSLITAHLAFADERINKQKVIGLAIGFSGVLVLSSEVISDGAVETETLIGQLAMIGASLCYATFTVYSRKMIKRDVEPIVLSSSAFIASAACAAVFVILEPLVGGCAWVPFGALSHDALLAVFLLGLTNTFIAYIFFYFIVSELGAFKAVMVTYVVPVVGLVLGIIVLDEIVTTAMLIGAAMILTGIAVINLRAEALRRRRLASGDVAVEIR